MSRISLNKEKINVGTSAISSQVSSFSQKAWRAVRIAGTIMGALFALSMLLIMGLFALVFISLFASVSDSTSGSGNVAVIPLHGIIVSGGSGGFFGDEVVRSTDVVDALKSADKDDEKVVIILDINSPGGTPVASAEIAEAVVRTKKPVYALIRDLGASGAYWVASATDTIYAHEASATGSIGVLASYVEYAGFLERYNFTYRKLTAGKYKETGSPYTRLTSDEEVLIQSELDALHTLFIDAVAKNRNKSTDYIRTLATGAVYYGKEAVALGLVDNLGTMNDVLAGIEQQYNITATPSIIQKEESLRELLTGVLSKTGFSVGAGFGKVLIDSSKLVPVLS